METKELRIGIRKTHQWSAYLSDDGAEMAICLNCKMLRKTIRKIDTSRKIFDFDRHYKDFIYTHTGVDYTRTRNKMICLPSRTNTAQTKPRKKVIQTHQIIFKDSIVYLLDTIACYFKELIISRGTVAEKWQKGYVVWQTWYLPNYSKFTLVSGKWGGLNSTEQMPIENKYNFSEMMPGIFLYADKTKVTNKVILTIKR